MDVNWGDVPGWIQAVATALALGAAGWAVGLEIKAGRRRDAQIEARAEDQRRAQASQVAIWASSPVIDDPQRAPRNRRYPGATVRNASRLPVFDVFVFVSRDDAAGPVETYLDSLPVIPPETTLTFELPDDLQIRPGTSVETLRIRFVDSASRRWERDGKGGLRPRS